MDDDSKYPSQLAERFQLRLPPGLRARIATEAKRNGRSMNTEIVSVLESRYPEPAPARDLLPKLEEIIAALRMQPDEPLTYGARYMIGDLIDQVREVGLFDKDEIIDP